MIVVPDLIVVDLAGTTMREDGAVMEAYRLALSQHGIPFTDADLAARRGANKRMVFRELAARDRSATEAEELAGQALATFEAALRHEYETGGVQEVEGTSDAVRRMKQAGVKVALSSGFDRDLVDVLVRRLGWVGLFDLVLSGGDAPVGRPAPFLIYQAMIALGVKQIARVAVVGDTALDLQAGANARAGWIIGVLSGAHGIELLGATTHTHLLLSIADLPSLFQLEQASS